MVQLWVDPSELSDPAHPYALEAAQYATSVLFALSGRKFPGAQTTTEIYRCKSSASGTCFTASRSGKGYAPTELPLRGKPVRRVIELRAGSGRTLVPESEYQLLDRKYLRPVGAASWRPCGMLEVTYVYGMMPPQMGRRAARGLANELVKMDTAPEECRLPDRVTSVSRQGVSFTILDPQDFLKDGRTGLYEVDLFLTASNPDGARAKARVFSPDGPHGRTITRVPTDPFLLGLAAPAETVSVTDPALQNLLAQRDSAKNPGAT